MRPEKTQMVEELSRQIGGSPYVLLTDYTGLTVGQFSELRKRLAGVAAECHVVKNSLMQRALAAANLPKANGALAGMTAVVVGRSESEIAAVAKVVKQFAKDTEKFKVKLGYMGAEALRPDQIAALADLPSRDVLRAQLLGLLQTPATRIAVVLSAPGSQLARLLKARAEKLGEAPAAVPAA